MLGACLNFILLGFPVLRKHTFNQVGHVYFLSAQVCFFEQLVEFFARRTNEHSSLSVFVLSRCLGNQHHSGIIVTLTGKGINSGFPQPALLAFSDFLLQIFKLFRSTACQLQTNLITITINTILNFNQTCLDNFLESSLGIIRVRVFLFKSFIIIERIFFFFVLCLYRVRQREETHGHTRLRTPVHIFTRLRVRPFVHTYICWVWVLGLEFIILPILSN
jgi:hypothetical protein